MPVSSNPFFILTKFRIKLLIDREDCDYFEIRHYSVIPMESAVVAGGQSPQERLHTEKLTRFIA